MVAGRYGSGRVVEGENAPLGACNDAWARWEGCFSAWVMAVRVYEQHQRKSCWGVVEVATFLDRSGGRVVRQCIAESGMVSGSVARLRGGGGTVTGRRWLPSPSALVAAKC